MPARIGPKRPRRVYLLEWREHFGLTQKRLADRLHVSEMTVSRWERDQHKLNTDVLAAVAEALGPDVEPMDLYRDPDQPSADALLRGAPADMVRETIDWIEFQKKRRAS